MALHVVLQKEIILRTILVICLSSCGSCFDDTPLPMVFSCALLPERVKYYLLCCLCLSLSLLTWFPQALQIYAVSGWSIPFCRSATLYLCRQWYMKTAEQFCRRECREQDSMVHLREALHLISHKVQKNLLFKI